MHAWPLRPESVSCPLQRFEEGTIVQLQVTLINPVSGARPIQRASGCDTLANGTCTVAIHGQKNVTIAVGCEIGCSGLLGAKATKFAKITKVFVVFVILVTFVMRPSAVSRCHRMAGAEPRKSAPRTCTEFPPSHESMIFA